MQNQKFKNPWEYNRWEEEPVWAKHQSQNEVIVGSNLYVNLDEVKKHKKIEDSYSDKNPTTRTNPNYPNYKVYFLTRVTKLFTLISKEKRDNIVLVSHGGDRANKGVLWLGYAVVKPGSSKEGGVWITSETIEDFNTMGSGMISSEKCNWESTNNEIVEGNVFFNEIQSFQTLIRMATQNFIIYGCHTGEGEEGRRLGEILSRWNPNINLTITGTEVEASGITTRLKCENWRVFKNGKLITSYNDTINVGLYENEKPLYFGKKQ